MTAINGGRATLRLSVAALRAHKRRFAGTFLAVLLGVSFLAGTMMMGDTLRASFNTLFASAGDGRDAVVRSFDVIAVSGQGQGVRQPVDTALVGRIRAVAGVADAEPDIEGAGQLVGRNGQPVGGKGPPTIAGNWIADARLNPYQIAQGHAPRAPGQVVISRTTATMGKLRIGDTTVLRTPDPVRVTIVGLATFGGQDGMAQATYTGMTLGDAEKYLMPRPGEASSIAVRAAPGTSQRQLVDTIAPVLPRGVEVITGERATAEMQQDASGQFLSLFTTLLTVFAGIALLVATFSIHNTFAIVLAQRTRDNALLRALGASRRQVVGSTLAEALAVAVVASTAGLCGGIGIAAGLQALFPAIGFPFPSGDLVVSASSLALPLAVGVLVCVGSALLPAVRAGRTTPLAALRETAVDRSGASRTRAAAAACGIAAGVALTVLGATGTPSILVTAVGATVTGAAFIVLGPVAAGYAVRVLGAPLARLRGVTGALARRNALRGPKRTAATATALMVGVAVVTLFTVFGASLKDTLSQTVSRSFAGDVAVSAPAFGAGGSGLSPRLAPALARLAQVDTAVGLGKGVAQVDGAGAQLTVADPAGLARALDLGKVDGALNALGSRDIAVCSDQAAKHGWRVGSVTTLRFTDGSTQRFTVGALYQQADLVGDYVIPRQAWEPHRTQDTDTLVAVTLRPGVSVADGKAAVARTAAAYGSPTVQTRAEYAKSSASGIDTMLTLVYALLALAVLIALLGITNTLTLAVYERTRELGLLRAVGQTRAQLRAMVRWESVLVAAFGTVGGLGLGVFLGWALVRGADSSGVSAFSLPSARLAVVLLVGLAAGVVAGLRPARRAARLDVLRAVAAQ